VLLNEKPVVEQYPGRIEKTRAAAAPYRQHLQQGKPACARRSKACTVRVTGACSTC
jgi:hypothetical protein